MRGAAAVTLALVLAIGWLAWIPSPAAAIWDCAGEGYAPDAGSELIANGGFESDLTNWVMPANPAGVSTSIFHSGSKSANVDSVAGVTTFAYQGLPSSPSVSVFSHWFYVQTWVSGGTFVAGLFGNADFAGSNQFVSIMQWWMANSTLRWDVWVPAGGGGGVTQYLPITVAPGAWHLFEMIMDRPRGVQCLFMDGLSVANASVTPASAFVARYAIFGDASQSGDAGIANYDDLSLLSANVTAPDYVPSNPTPSGTAKTGLGLPVALSVQVRNEGNETPTSNATLAFYNQSTPASPFAQFSVPILAPGQATSSFGATWTAPATPGSYLIVADVDYSGDVLEGNESNNVYVWTVEVYPPPITTLSLGTPNYLGTYVSSTTDLTLSAADQSGTGIQRTRYRIDGGAWSDYVAPFRLTGEGNHLVEYLSEDNVGNVEATRGTALRVDDSPPTTTLSLGLPSYNGTFITSATTLSLTALDGGVTPSGVASIEYRIDGGPWLPYAAAFTLPTEGAHAVEYRATDHLGNAEAIRSRPLVVDNAPPTTILAIGSPSYGVTFVTSATPLTLSAADGGTPPVGVELIEYRIDGGVWQTYTAAFTLAGEAVHLVEYRASDFLGNSEGTRSRSLTVDNSPPLATVGIGIPSYTAAETWIRSTTPLSLNAVDRGVIPVGLSSAEYRVWTGTWTAWSSYASPFTIPAEGRRYVEWRASDFLGNTAAGNTSLVVDDAPPNAQVSVFGPSYSPPSGGLWVTSASAIWLAAQDGGAIPVGLTTLEFRLWYGAWSGWSAYAAPFSLSGEGQHYLEWRATDRLGNTAAGNVSIVLDDTPPSSQANVSGPNVTASQTFVTSATLIVLTATDGGLLPAGLSVLEYSFNGLAWTPYTGPITLQGPDGLWIVYFRATDHVGNREADQILALFLDNTAPSTSFSRPPPPLSVASRYALESADAGSGVALTEYSVDGGAWVPYTGPFSLPVGNHEIRYRSTDRLGNQEVQRTTALIVENWKPVIAMLFALVIAIIGLLLVRRSRRDSGEHAWWKRFLVGSLPFVVAEIATGAISALTGSLTVPPLLDLGMIVDFGILAAGLVAAAALAARARRPPTPAS